MAHRWTNEWDTHRSGRPRFVGFLSSLACCLCAASTSCRADGRRRGKGVPFISQFVRRAISTRQTVTVGRKTTSYITAANSGWPDVSRCAAWSTLTAACSLSLHSPQQHSLSSLNSHRQHWVISLYITAVTILFFTVYNKTIVDIRLRPRCAITPLTLYASLT